VPGAPDGREKCNVIKKKKEEIKNEKTRNVRKKGTI
jgi:hypothetical protein